MFHVLRPICYVLCAMFYRFAECYESCRARHRPRNCHVGHWLYWKGPVHPSRLRCDSRTKWIKRDENDKREKTVIALRRPLGGQEEGVVLTYFGTM